MKSLKLFNAVESKPSTQKPFLSDKGFIIESEALWAKDVIEQYHVHNHLSNEGLNSTFHKSWNKIRYTDRFSLYLEQIRHYISTYGTGFTGDVYIPNEVLNVPDFNVAIKVYRGYSKEDLVKKGLHLFNSGIALTEEAIDDVTTLLFSELSFNLQTVDDIKNKEAMAKLADVYNILPSNPTEFLRYLVYKATNTTTLIKNQQIIDLVKNTNFNISPYILRYDLTKLSSIYNRYKPIFLAFKSKSPKLINKLAKLSKKNHEALTENPLNKVTSILLKDEDVHWLDNATPFALFKALQATYNRKKGQDTFNYRIRNGKSWVKVADTNMGICKGNYKFLVHYLKNRVSFDGKTFYIPENIEYALPTSEKLFVGNIPTGTKIFGKKLAVGVYWENKGGARDIDLSGLNLNGKVGWNSTYNQNGSLLYSGDVTDATNGAVEYLYAANGLGFATLVNVNIYSGSNEAIYKIIVGKGDKMSRDYMMNPSNLVFEMECKSVQQQTVLGLIYPQKDEQCFVLLNFGGGDIQVSGNGEISELRRKALVQQYENSLSLNKIIKVLGGELVSNPKEADYDFSINKLEKDTLIKLFCK